MAGGNLDQIVDITIVSDLVSRFYPEGVLLGTLLESTFLACVPQQIDTQEKMFILTVH